MRKLFLTLSLLFCTSQILWGNTVQCDGTTLHPCIVEDTQNNSPEVKHWRDSEDIEIASTAHKLNTKGLSHLWMSGSAAPSEEGWKKIAIAIIKTSDNKVEHIIDLDLRQESHGYLNQNAINLTSQNDWINLGKSHDQILHDENKWLHILSKKKFIPDILTPEQFKADKFSQGKTLSVENVMTEEKMAEAAGFKYYRLTISDHMSPRDSDVDQFLTLVKKIKPNTWIHFHCRGGDGRTTTFMAMYDMLHNADHVPLNTIIKRQAAVDPFYNLFATAHKNKNLSVYYQNRKVFLEKFYQYAQARLKGYAGTWTAWKNKNS